MYLGNRSDNSPIVFAALAAGMALVLFGYWAIGGLVIVVVLVLSLVPAGQ